MRGGRARVLYSGLCAIFIALLAAPLARAESFCDPGVVHDYLKPLKELPALRGEPAKQQLPFAPRNLFFGSIGQGALIVGNSTAGKQEVGYFLDYTPTSPHPTGRYLNWLVTAKLNRIDSTGRVLQGIGFKQVRGIRFHSSHALSFELSEEPALYRLEVVFRNSAGKRLGRFGRYLRAVESHSDVRFTLAQSAYHSGETVSPRLENEGTDRLLYGLAYRIEQFDGASWIPTSLGPKFFLAIGLSSSPGEAASCWGFRVSAETPAGKYRLSTSTDVYETTARDERAKQMPLNAEFEVVP